MHCHISRTDGAQASFQLLLHSSNKPMNTSQWLICSFSKPETGTKKKFAMFLKNHSSKRSNELLSTVVLNFLLLSNRVGVMVFNECISVKSKGLVNFLSRHSYEFSKFCISFVFLHDITSIKDFIIIKMKWFGLIIE